MLEYRNWMVIGFTGIAATAAVIALYTLRKQKVKKIVFGKRCKLHDFMLKESVTFCNNGSLAAAPRKVIETQRKFQLEQESNPEGWYRYQMLNIYSNAIDKVAGFVGSDKENLVLVENVTTAINAVMKSLHWLPGDKILITNQTYEAVKNIAIFISQMHKGVEIVTMDVCFPIDGKKQLIDQLVETLDADKEIKLAILDHITSVSAILMPIEEMTSECHKRGVMVMVDGAHAPGQVKLQLDKLGADFYTGNLHKWCFATRGCALLHIDPKHSDVIHPLVTSHAQFHSRLRDRFMQQATRDYTSLCIATAAIEFMEDIGMEAMSQYNTNLVDWAADMLANAWKTTHLPVHRSLRAPFMALVRLPENIIDVELNYDVSNKLLAEIYRKYKVHCACTVVDNKLWVRVSAQIYNYKDDYFKLRDAVADFTRRK